MPTGPYIAQTQLTCSGDSGPREVWVRIEQPMTMSSPGPGLLDRSNISLAAWAGAAAISRAPAVSATPRAVLTYMASLYRLHWQPSARVRKAAR